MHFTSCHLAGNRNNCHAKHVGLMCVKCSPFKLLNVITVQAAFSHYIFLVAKPISMAAFLLPDLLSFWCLWCGSRRRWDQPASSSGCGTMLDMGKRRQGLCNLTSSPRPSAALQAALPYLCFPLRFPVTLLWQEMSCARHKGLGRVFCCLHLESLPHGRPWSVPWHSPPRPGSEAAEKCAFPPTLSALRIFFNSICVKNNVTSLQITEVKVYFVH